MVSGRVVVHKTALPILVSQTLQTVAAVAATICIVI